MSKEPLFRFLSDDPKLPLDLRALAAGHGDCGAAPRRLGLDFAFTYLSLPLRCRYEDGTEQGQLTITATVGPMPFSAESPAARAALLAVVAAANQHLGQTFRIEGGRIVLMRRRALDMPVSAAGLVGAAIAALVPLKSYISVIGTYLVLPGEAPAPGASRVKPIWRRPPPVRRAAG